MKYLLTAFLEGFISCWTSFYPTKIKDLENKTATEIWDTIKYYLKLAYQKINQS